MKRRSKRRKKTPIRPKTLFVTLGIVLVVAVGIVVAARMQRDAYSGSAVVLPDFVQSGGPAVRTAYLNAIRYKDEFAEIHCYCGCETSVGHESLKDCHIAEERADGSFVFDDHSSR